MDDADRNKLFVGGISWETTEDVLNEHFYKYGVVSGSVIAKDRVSGQPRGFAFVTFSDSSAVDRALQDSHQILSRTVEVKRAIPRSEQQSQLQYGKGLSRNFGGTNNGRSSDEFRTKKIFVGGLAANLTEEEFGSYFAKFGRITDVVVMHDNMTHRPRGFGFITYDSEDSVEEVMQKNFHELAGKLVEVKRAVPKDGSNSSGNGYGRRLGSDRVSNFNSYQPGDYMPYNPRFGYFPTGYGSVAGHPYAAGMFGGYGGIGYGLSPVVPRSPWSPAAMVGVRGSFLPYANPIPVFSSYLNGGPIVMGLGPNGYGVFSGSGFVGKSGQMDGGDGQHEAESTLSQSAASNVGSNHFGAGRGLGAGASRQGKRANGKTYQETTNSS